MDIFDRIDSELQDKILEAFMEMQYDKMQELIRLYGLEKIRDEFNVALVNLGRLKGFMDNMIQEDQDEFMKNGGDE